MFNDFYSISPPVNQEIFFSDSSPHFLFSDPLEEEEETEVLLEKRERPQNFLTKEEEPPTKVQHREEKASLEADIQKRDPSTGVIEELNHLVAKNLELHQKVEDLELENQKLKGFKGQVEDLEKKNTELSQKNRDLETTLMILREFLKREKQSPSS